MATERCARCGRFLPRFARSASVVIEFDQPTEVESYLFADTVRAKVYGLRPVLPLRSHETARTRVCPTPCRRSHG